MELWGNTGKSMKTWMWGSQPSLPSYSSGWCLDWKFLPMFARVAVFWVIFFYQLGEAAPPNNDRFGTPLWSGGYLSAVKGEEWFCIWGLWAGFTAVLQTEIILKGHINCHQIILIQADSSVTFSCDFDGSWAQGIVWAQWSWGEIFRKR